MKISCQNLNTNYDNYFFRTLLFNKLYFGPEFLKCYHNKPDSYQTIIYPALAIIIIFHVNHVL